MAERKKKKKKTQIIFPPPPLTSEPSRSAFRGPKSKPRSSFQELTCVSAACTCVGLCECVPDGGAYRWVRGGRCAGGQAGRLEEESRGSRGQTEWDGGVTASNIRAAGLDPPTSSSRSHQLKYAKFGRRRAVTYPTSQAAHTCTPSLAAFFSEQGLLGILL